MTPAQAVVVTVDMISSFAMLREALSGHMEKTNTILLVLNFYFCFVLPMAVEVTRRTCDL